MRKKFISILAVILICILVLTSCAGNTRYAGLQELSDAVQFNVTAPTFVPDGYSVAGYFASGNNIAEIVYVKGESQLIYVMTTSKKIESDLGPFEESKDLEAGGAHFTMSLSGGLVHLVVAQAGDFNYGIYSKAGLVETDAERMAEGLNLGGKAQ